MVDVAVRVFSERGYYAASMEDIAERADVSKPMLYSYFGSKEGLYLASIERAGNDLLERLGRAAGGDDADGQLRAGMVAFFEFVGERRDGWTVLYQQGDAVSPAVASVRSGISGLVRDLLGQRATERGHVLSDDRHADALAHAFVGAVESLANWWLEHPECSMEIAVEWLVNLARHGLWAAADAPATSAG